jgi:drug/metabolite transporter (DMT)-like permease
MLLGAIWGASFMFIKIGVSEMGPMTFAMLRVLIASAVLYVILRVKGQRLPSEKKTWKHLAFMGFFNALVPFGLMAWGTQHIASGLSSILNATMPLFTFTLAVLSGGERPNGSRIAGLLVGFGGILILTAPKLRGGIDVSFWGELAVIAGSLSYAIATVYARRNLKGQPPLVASLGQVSMGCLFLIPFSLLEQPWTMRPSLEATGALLTLGILGTALAYLIYYRLLQGVGATVTSLVTYIAPIFGIFWGWLILDERLSWHAFAALGLILVGMVLVNNLLGQFAGRSATSVQVAGK